jgi:hypothetical protein
LEATVKNRTRQLAVAMTTVLVTLGVNASVALAQVPDPAPDGSMPGASLVTSMLGWLKWAALAAAVAGILGGGVATGVGHFGNNYGAASAGRKWVLGGVGAAALAGMAHTFASQIYNAV